MTAGGGGPYLLAVDAGTGSCRALLFTAAGEQPAVSLREWAHREPPGVPRGQDFDVESNCLPITAHPGRAPAGRRDRGPGRGGGRDQHARASSSTTLHGPELWACPNVVAAAQLARRPELDAEGAADGFARVADWVSITCRRCAGWPGTTPACCAR
jgi:autoinducer 2 (AI-2) kinase